MLEFLYDAMNAANDKFKLGLDLSELKSARESAGDDAGLPSPIVRGADEADASSTLGDAFDGDSGASEAEDSASPGSLRKSVAGLKLSSGTAVSESASIGAAAQAPLSVSLKAISLRCYLKDNTSEVEFSQVQGLIRNSLGASGDSTDLQRDGKDLKDKVVAYLGTDRAEPLLPMFQLLDFLEAVATSLQADADASATSSEPLSPASSHKDLLKSTFRRFDLNVDGFISREELQRVLKVLGTSDEDISMIFIAADRNADGKIDYTEFVDWLYSGGALSAFGINVPTVPSKK